MTLRKTLWRAALMVAMVATLGQTSMASAVAPGQASKSKRKPLRAVWVQHEARRSDAERPGIAPSRARTSPPRSVEIRVGQSQPATLSTTRTALPDREAVVSNRRAPTAPSTQRSRVVPRQRSLRGVQEFVGDVQDEPMLRFEVASADQAPSQARAPAGRRPAPARSSSKGTYILGAGDVLDIFVWRNDELSRTVPVRPDGYISLPLAGELVATGKTVHQLQDEITVALSQYVQVPTVTVTITQVRSLVVYVLGSVAKPGPLQLDRQVTPLQAIAMAGGLTEFADKNDITILRTVNGREQRIEFRYGDFVKGKGQSGAILLRAGDVVYVP